MPSERSQRSALLESCLENARHEIVRRLVQAGLPTSIKSQRLVLKDNDEGTGWSSEWETIGVSPLQFIGYQMAVRDETVPARAIGLREQLMPLAAFVDSTTSLGEKQAWGMFPGVTGAEGVLLRVVNPLALSYLANLRNLSRKNSGAVRRLDEELTSMCESTRVTHRSQLVVAGLRVPRRLGPYRRVSLRALTGAERGLLQELGADWTERPASTPDFVLPRRFSMLDARALLEVTESRARGTQPDVSTLTYRVALSLYLHGFDIASTGVLLGYDEPRWAFTGASHAAFPVQERWAFEQSRITRKRFEAVVDLAHAMPSFSGLEDSGRAIVLSRVLRGFGGEDSGFLDFAIALEAALLGGTTSELSYRFSLNGALFLSDTRDASQTFESLKNIYNVRSKLVHGAAVKPEARAAAERDAADLARAVTRKAIENGWPNDKALREQALA